MDQNNRALVRKRSVDTGTDGSGSRISVPIQDIASDTVTTPSFAPERMASAAESRSAGSSVPQPLFIRAVSPGPGSSQR